jgi:hypothetical protein
MGTHMGTHIAVNRANYEKSRDCIINANLAVILGILVTCKRTYMMMIIDSN